MPESKLIQKPGAPIKWEHSSLRACWNTHGHDYHFALHASRVQGIGKPYNPAPPKGTLYGDAKPSNPGYAKSVAELLQPSSLMQFLNSLPDSVRAFFVCQRKSENGECFSDSVMKGFVIGGKTIQTVLGNDIARMQQDSEAVRTAMQAFRAAGRYVNGRFDERKTQFVFKDCRIVRGAIDCNDVVYNPECYGKIKLIYGMDEGGNIVDAIYVAKDVPVIVVRREENKKLGEEGRIGCIVHKECPHKRNVQKNTSAKQQALAVPA